MTTLAPKPGFGWLNIAWEGPDETPGEHCSYCGDKIAEEEIPLILWNEQGFTARFCDHCSCTWFGLRTFPPEPDED